MKQIFFLVFLLASAFAQSQQEGEDSCSVCTTLVSVLENYVGAHVSREDVMKELAAVSARVCESIPQQVGVTKEQCNSFVTLYGPYTIDLVLSEAKPDSVCKSMGFCEGKDYKYTPRPKFLFPTLTANSVTFNANEKEILQDTTFYYSLFLPNATFLSANAYELSVGLSQIQGASVSMKVTNTRNYMEQKTCSEANCNIVVVNPGKSVTYYVTVNAKVHSGKKASFVLTATERNSSTVLLPRVHFPVNTMHFAFTLSFILALGCLFCMCITRCVFRRRACKVQQREEPILMQVVPETKLQQYMPLMQNHDFMPMVQNPDGSFQPVVIVFPSSEMNDQMVSVQ